MKTYLFENVFFLQIVKELILLHLSQLQGILSLYMFI